MRSPRPAGTLVSTFVLETPSGNELLTIREKGVRDTYGIEVAPNENDALILAAAVCIDEMAHD